MSSNFLGFKSRMLRHLLAASVFLACVLLPALALQVTDLPIPLQPGTDQGAVQILTKLSAEQLRVIDENHVIRKLIARTNRTWFSEVPVEARRKKGSVDIEFTLHPDGSVTQMYLAKRSGDVALDRAAWHGITGAANYPAFPPGLDVPELRLRFHFVYSGGA